jgi:UV DNA damage repair endonuclease
MPLMKTSKSVTLMKPSKSAISLHKPQSRKGSPQKKLKSTLKVLSDNCTNTETRFDCCQELKLDLYRLSGYKQLNQQLGE